MRIVGGSRLLRRKRLVSFPKFMPMFSSFCAYVLIKTRREFIHLRRLLEIFEIGCFMTMDSCFYLLIFYLFLHLHSLLLGQNFLNNLFYEKERIYSSFGFGIQAV